MKNYLTIALTLVSLSPLSTFAFDLSGEQDHRRYPLGDYGVFYGDNCKESEEGKNKSDTKECSQNELINIVETEGETVLEDIIRVNGGNIDGGGTDLDYPTFKEVEAAFNTSLNLVTTSEEGKNLAQHLRDRYPSLRDQNFEYIEPYTEVDLLLAEGLDSTSSNEHFLQLIVGDKFRTKVERYKACRYHGKGVKNIYSNNPIVYDLKDCSEVSLFRQSPFKLLLRDANIDFKEKCFDQNGVEKLGSVSEFSLKADICLSKSKFLKVPTKNLQRVMTSVLLHEISHMFGANEEQAKAFEDFIYFEFPRNYEIIKNLDQEIDQRKQEILSDLNLNRLTYGTIEPFERSNVFRKFLFETDLLKAVDFQIVPKEEILFLYPFETAMKVFSIQKKIKQHIKTHFEDNYGSFITPIKGIFSEEEILVFNGINPLSTSSGKSFSKKMNHFLGILSQYFSDMSEAMYMTNVNLPLTNRRDVMMYFDQFKDDFDITYNPEKLIPVYFGEYEYYKKLRVKSNYFDRGHVSED